MPIELRSMMMFYSLGLVLSVPVLFLSIPKQASIFCSVFIGCCLAVLPIDFYLGGFYKYLIINIIRRVATVDFQYAVVYMPLQVRNGLLTCMTRKPCTCE